MAGWHSNFSFPPEEAFRNPPSWNSFTILTNACIPPPPPLYNGAFQSYPSRRMPSPSVSFTDGQPNICMPAIGASVPDMGGYRCEPQLSWTPVNASGRERFQPTSHGSMARGSAGYDRHAERMHTEESFFKYTHHQPFQAITELTEDYSQYSKDNASHDDMEASPKRSFTIVPALSTKLTDTVVDSVPHKNFTTSLEDVEPGHVKAAKESCSCFLRSKKKCTSVSQGTSTNDGASSCMKETETQTEGRYELIHKSSQTEWVTGKRRLRSYDSIDCVNITADLLKKEVRKLQIEVCSLRAEQCIKDLHRQMLMLTQDKTLWQTYFASRSETKAGVCDMVEERISWLHSEIHRLQEQLSQCLCKLEKGEILTSLPQFFLVLPDNNVYLPAATARSCSDTTTHTKSGIETTALRVESALSSVDQSTKRQKVELKGGLQENLHKESTQAVSGEPSENDLSSSARKSWSANDRSMVNPDKTKSDTTSQKCHVRALSFKGNRTANKSKPRTEQSSGICSFPVLSLNENFIKNDHEPSRKKNEGQMFVKATRYSDKLDSDKVRALCDEACQTTSQWQDLDKSADLKKIVEVADKFAQTSLDDEDAPSARQANASTTSFTAGSEAVDACCQEKRANKKVQDMCTGQERSPEKNISEMLSHRQSEDWPEGEGGEDVLVHGDGVSGDLTGTSVLPSSACLNKCVHFYSMGSLETKQDNDVRAGHRAQHQASHNASPGLSDCQTCPEPLDHQTAVEASDYQTAVERSDYQSYLETTDCKRDVEPLDHLATVGLADCGTCKEHLDYRAFWEASDNKISPDSLNGTKNSKILDFGTSTEETCHKTLQEPVGGRTYLGSSDQTSSINQECAMPVESADLAAFGEPDNTCLVQQQLSLGKAVAPCTVSESCSPSAVPVIMNRGDIVSKDDLCHVNVCAETTDLSRFRPACNEASLHYSHESEFLDRISHSENDASHSASKALSSVAKSSSSLPAGDIWSSGTSRGLELNALASISLSPKMKDSRERFVSPQDGRIHSPSKDIGDCSTTHGSECVIASASVKELDFEAEGTLEQSKKKQGSTLEMVTAEYLETKIIDQTEAMATTASSVTVLASPLASYSGASVSAADTKGLMGRDSAGNPTSPSAVPSDGGLAFTQHPTSVVSSADGVTLTQQFSALPAAGSTTLTQRSPSAVSSPGGVALTQHSPSPALSAGGVALTHSPSAVTSGGMTLTQHSPSPVPSAGGVVLTQYSPSVSSAGGVALAHSPSAVTSGGITLTQHSPSPVPSAGGVVLTQYSPSVSSAGGVALAHSPSAGSSAGGITLTQHDLSVLPSTGGVVLTHFPSPVSSAGGMTLTQHALSAVPSGSGVPLTHSPFTVSSAGGLALAHFPSTVPSGACVELTHHLPSAVQSAAGVMLAQCSPSAVQSVDGMTLARHSPSAVQSGQVSSNTCATGIPTLMSCPAPLSAPVAAAPSTMSTLCPVLPTLETTSSFSQMSAVLQPTSSATSMALSEGSAVGIGQACLSGTSDTVSPFTRQIYLMVEAMLIADYPLQALDPVWLQKTAWEQTSLLTAELQIQQAVKKQPSAASQQLLGVAQSGATTGEPCFSQLASKSATQSAWPWRTCGLSLAPALVSTQSTFGVPSTNCRASSDSCPQSDATLMQAGVPASDEVWAVPPGFENAGILKQSSRNTKRLSCSEILAPSVTAHVPASARVKVPGTTCADGKNGQSQSTRLWDKPDVVNIKKTSPSTGSNDRTSAWDSTAVFLKAPLHPLTPQLSVCAGEFPLAKGKSGDFQNQSGSTRIKSKTVPVDHEELKIRVKKSKQDNNQLFPARREVKGDAMVEVGLKEQQSKPSRRSLSSSTLWVQPLTFLHSCYQRELHQNSLQQGVL